MFLAAVIDVPAKDVAKAAAQSSLTILESSVLGAAAILFLVTTILATWKAFQIYEKWISDKEKAAKAMSDLVVRMTETLSETASALDKLSEADGDQQELLRGVKASLDGVVTESIRQLGRHSSPPRGTPTATRRGV